MRVLHLVSKGGIGGVECLCTYIAKYSDDENIFYFLWGGGENAEKIIKLGKTVYVRNLHKSKRKEEYRFLKEVCIARQVECVVIHGLSPMMFIFSMNLKKQINNLKLFDYLHSNSEDCFGGLKGIIRKAIFYKIQPSFNGCIAISKSVAESFAKYYDRNKIHVIYNAVDLEKFHLEKPRTERKKNITLMYIGRLEPYKGVDVLIKAITKLSEPVKLIIVGDGSSRKRLKKMAEKLKINICFMGTQTNVQEWLKQADIFVHPAVWQEGFGITLIESMAMGVPCIAFCRGAIPEIISDEKNGFLVENVTPNALAKKIMLCMNIIKTSPEKWNEICASASISVKKYDAKKYVKELSKYISSN